MIRSDESHTKHNAMVERLAQDYKRRGFYLVRADLPGYPKPASYGGLRPDIEALGVNTQHKTVIVIVEVETEDTVDTKDAKAQKAAFEQAVAGKKNTHFELHVVPN